MSGLTSQDRGHPPSVILDGAQNSGFRAPKRLLMALVRAYQLTLSPLIGPACRYQPSCSEYACQAIERHGSLRGAWIALRRLSRCHPLSGSGYDPVP